MRRISLACVAGAALLTAACSGSSDSDDDTTSLPSKYPVDWGVIYNDSVPPQAAPIAPDDGHSDGYGVDGFGGAARWSRYLGLERKTTTYKKGETFYTGGPALEADVIHQQDVPVILRDGKRIFVDVFRPAGTTEKLPVMVVYGPYGKSVPTNPRWTYPSIGESLVGTVSGLAAFESPDPAYWCTNGYIVVNVDPRGVNSSQGDIHAWGMVQAGDAYDVVEWAAAQDWSTGKVAMQGVSQLGILQWFVAALKPPHLVAIAPWGAHQNDIYRQDVMIGGIPSYGFNKMIYTTLMGGPHEAVYDMAQKYPLWHPYWEDKVAKLQNVDIPVYSVGNLGTMGIDTDGYRGAASKDKWLVVRHEQQWYDQYQPNRNSEAKAFFDHYMKGVSNGWESTPKVRVPVVDESDGFYSTKVAHTTTGDAWPLPQTQYAKYYLDAGNSTLSTSVPATSEVKYDAATGSTTFTFTFSQDTEMTGYVSMRLYVEAAGANDLDLFVTVKKLGTDNSVLYSPTGGQQRASLRALDRKKSKDYLPVHSFAKNEYLSSGQVVPVDIAINPMAVYFHRGQKLSVTVGGSKLASSGVYPTNAGEHVIHTGTGNESYILLPVIN